MQSRPLDSVYLNTNGTLLVIGMLGKVICGRNRGIEVQIVPIESRDGLVGLLQKQRGW